MISIKLDKTYTLDIITARKLKQTIAYNKKFQIISAQKNKDEEAIIDEMCQFISDIYSFKKGEEVVRQFTADDVLDYLPIDEIQDTFEETIDAIFKAFEGKSKKK